MKTITDITTVHTASSARGIGAGTIHHIGAHGATDHGTTEAGTEAPGTTPAGMTLGTTIHGTTADTMEDGTDVTTHGIMEAGTDGTTDGTVRGTTTIIITTTVGTIHTIIHHMAQVILLSEEADTKIDTTVQELTLTARRSEGTTASSKEVKAYLHQEPQPQRVEVSEQAAAQAEIPLFHEVHLHQHQDLHPAHAAVRPHIEDLSHQLLLRALTNRAAARDTAGAQEAHTTVHPATAAVTKGAAEATAEAAHHQAAEATAEAVHHQAADIAEAAHQEVIDVN